jgi:hypothetical protein
MKSLPAAGNRLFRKKPQAGPELSPIIWCRLDDRLRQRLAKLLNAKATAGLFDADYVKALAAQRQDKAAMANRLMIFGLTLSLFMAAWLFIDGLKLSVLELSADHTDKIIEIVVLLSACSGAYLALVKLEDRNLLAILDEITSRRATPAAAPFLGLAYRGVGEGLVLSPDPTDHVLPTRTTTGFFIAWAILMGISVAVFILASAAVQIAVLWQMFFHPAIGPVAPRFIASVAIVFTLASYGAIAFMYLRFPFRDYTDVAELGPLFERNKEAWTKAMQARLAARGESRN